jgi:hypothetical protein
MIRPLIEEAAEALSKNEGSDFLPQYLEKIREIKEGLLIQDETYDAFLSSYMSQYDFNLNAREVGPTKEVL